MVVVGLLSLLSITVSSYTVFSSFTYPSHYLYQLVFYLFVPYQNTFTVESPANSSQSLYSSSQAILLLHLRISKLPALLRAAFFASGEKGFDIIGFTTAHIDIRHRIVMRLMSNLTGV